MSKSQLKPVNIDLPAWVVMRLDKEAERIGISRKALINVLLTKSLQSDLFEPNPKKDLDYLRSIEANFSAEWLSKDDEEAFDGL